MTAARSSLPFQQHTIAAAIKIRYHGKAHLAKFYLERITMYKKLIVSLSLLAILFGMTACGKETAPNPTAVPTQQTAPLPETTVPETTLPETTLPAFAPVVLVDDENCTVTVTGIDEDALFGYTLKVFLENKTDKELMYSLDNVSVNGFMCDPFWAATVAAGKKSNEEITFFDSDFEANGITEVSEITFTLQVYDNNDWMADRQIEQEFTIHP